MTTLISAPSASAQSDENRAAARAAAAQGVEAEEAGRWSEAIELFTRAEALVHAPPHWLHIARADVKLGRLVAAQEAYLKITREELPPSAPRAFVEARTAANQELEALAPRIPTLKISLVGGTGTVTMDDAPVPPAMVGIPFPVDPGRHQLSARGSGLKSATTTIDVAEGRQQAVRLVLEPAPEATATPAAAAAEPKTEPAAPAPTSPPHRSMVPAYVAWGVGGAGIALGTAMMFVNRGKRDDADALCPNGACPQSKKTTIDDLDASADRAATFSWIGYGVGAAGLVIGTVYFVMNRNASAEAEKSGATLRPWFGANTAGFSGGF